MTTEYTSIVVDVPELDKAEAIYPYITELLSAWMESLHLSMAECFYDELAEHRDYQTTLIAAGYMHREVDMPTMEKAIFESVNVIHRTMCLNYNNTIRHLLDREQIIDCHKLNAVTLRFILAKRT